jgi:hypothetical protein
MTILDRPLRKEQSFEFSLRKNCSCEETFELSVEKVGASLGIGVNLFRFALRSSRWMSNFDLVKNHLLDFIPSLKWIPRYRLSHIRYDIVAGLGVVGIFSCDFSYFLRQ